MFATEPADVEDKEETAEAPPAKRAKKPSAKAGAATAAPAAAAAAPKKRGGRAPGSERWGSPFMKPGGLGDSAKPDFVSWMREFGRFR